MAIFLSIQVDLMPRSIKRAELNKYLYGPQLFITPSGDVVTYEIDPYTDISKLDSVRRYLKEAFLSLASSSNFTKAFDIPSHLEEKQVMYAIQDTALLSTSWRADSLYVHNKGLHSQIA